MPPAPDPAAPDAVPLVAARALTCRRGRRLLFRGVDLALARGSITWLRGTNGSGKTSLLRLLAGLSAPAEGEVLWSGQAPRAAAPEVRAGIVYIGHLNALKDDLTLTEAVTFLGTLAGVPEAAARTAAALERFGLAARRQAPVRTLSQGQRRRGALARLALDEAPRCWILDEPYDALDQASVDNLSALISDHAGRGGSVLLTSHQAVALPGARAFDLEPFRAP